MLQSVVRYDGMNGTGPEFTCHVGYQVPVEDDDPGSANQLDAANLFYGCEQPDDLTDWQLHCLLSGRDLAIGCAEALFPKLSGDRSADVARFVACFISMDEPIALAAVDFMDARRDQGEPPEGLSAAVTRFRYWPDVQQFAVELVTDLSAQGYRLGSGPK